MPLGPRCGSKPAGSAENAAIRVPPGLAAAKVGRPHGPATTNAAAAARPTLKRRREIAGTPHANKGSEHAIAFPPESCLLHGAACCLVNTPYPVSVNVPAAKVRPIVSWRAA